MSSLKLQFIYTQMIITEPRTTAFILVDLCLAGLFGEGSSFWFVNNIEFEFSLISWADIEMYIGVHLRLYSLFGCDTWGYPAVPLLFESACNE